MSDDDGNNDARVARSIARKLHAQSSNPKSLQPFRLKARFIAQSVHPYMDLTRVFFAGTPEAVNENENEPIDYDEKEVDAFNAIMLLQRGFKKVVKACAEDALAFSALIKVITDASAASRNDDVSTLKAKIIEYMHEEPGVSRLSFEWDLTSLQPRSKKDMRGWNHVETADHLCPLRLKAEFDKNPEEFIAQVTENKLIITADDLPSFLYPDGTAYSPRHICRDLFRGHLLVRVFRHIFTAPSSALDPNERANKSKARGFKLTSATPRTIAYAAVQTYIALSEKKGWCSTVRGFNLVTFYETIVDIFETNKHSKWVGETLEWFNDQVPGLRSRHGNAKRQPTDTCPPPRSGPTLAQRIANQIEDEEEPPIAPANTAAVRPRHQPPSAQPSRNRQQQPPSPRREKENAQRTTPPNESPLATPKHNRRTVQQAETPVQRDNPDDSDDLDDSDDNNETQRLIGKSNKRRAVIESDDELDPMDIYEDDNQAADVPKPSESSGKAAAIPNPGPSRTSERGQNSKSSSRRPQPRPPSSRVTTRSASRRLELADEDEDEDDTPLAKRKRI